MEERLEDEYVHLWQAALLASMTHGRDAKNSALQADAAVAEFKARTPEPRALKSWESGYVAPAEEPAAEPVNEEPATDDEDTEA